MGKAGDVAGSSVLFSWASLWQKTVQLGDPLAQFMGSPTQMQKCKFWHGFINHLINLQQNSFWRTNEEWEPDLKVKDECQGHSPKKSGIQILGDVN